MHLARLGLKGDAASVSRLVRKLLQEFSNDSSVPMKIKEALADLIANQPSPIARFVDGGFAAPSTSPFLRLERDTDADDPLLATDVAAQLATLVNEHSNRERLASVGLLPTRTLLLTGPPGVGKTMAARAVARRLGLPLLSVDLSALMSSFLGKTGQNLRDAFATARLQPSVLLLDEFDAVAKRRDDQSDVGELKRIVNILLIELEMRAPAGLVIAATNHPELLDRAIWRRFERVVHLNVPTPEVRRALIERELNRLGSAPDPSAIDVAVATTEGASCADTVLLARRCVRSVVLNEQNLDEVVVSESVERLRALATSDHNLRPLYCQVASRHLKHTQRVIGKELGISHVMVGKLMRQGGRDHRRSAGQDEYV